MKLESLSIDESPVIGRYKVLGVLGSGGMGRVLLAVGPDGRAVAIKQIHSHLLADNDFRARFRREVHASSLVSGAYTAAVIDADVECETPWLASVFVTGLPLEEAVNSYGPLPDDSVCSLAAGLASALITIHQVGLIHRDLKPANVILSADGPRVIDFGIARAAEGRSALTHTGSVIGSPAYMSPEQAQSMPLTPASDVFALGAVLVMSMTGRSPFASTSMPLTLYKIVHTEPDLSLLSPEMRQLVGPCLHPDPAARPTPAQILAHLSRMRPRALPWPPQIHEAIVVQERNLRDLLTDPDATRIRQEPVVASVAPPTDTGDAGPPSSRRRVLPALLIAGVVVALVVLFVLHRPSAGEGVTDPLAHMSLVDMRTVDTCALLGAVAPASIGVLTETAEVSGCTGKNSEHTVTVRFAETSRFHRTDRTAEGMPLLDTAAPSDLSCAMAIQPTALMPQSGIVVSIDNGGGCPVVQQMLTSIIGQLRTEPPRLARSDDYLVVADPCSLVSTDLLTNAIGATGTGTTLTPHTCRWGDNTLSLDVSSGRGARADGPNARRIDLENGMVAYAGTTSDSEQYCLRTYQYRVIDENRADLVTARVDHTSGTGACTAAERVLAGIAAKLPR
ncbi:serine/threonine-protein kinase [Nocardia africana]|uniref:Serine/threonine-protein kinase AfsK n=1 Tax=Nocardia africana TaxID=134964 RepID=A0A378X404_9NOCA|nr:serine/threonine-protein kinase [Nocardia africana]MCC3317416.1 serine/threonine protein kinase [Nocardia africana]SUA48169.1 Serine/threonine-protein kinase AfsK [Nocardia africana]